MARESLSHPWMTVFFLVWRSVAFTKTFFGFLGVQLATTIMVKCGYWKGQVSSGPALHASSVSMPPSSARLELDFASVSLSLSFLYVLVFKTIPQAESIAIVTPQPHFVFAYGLPSSCPAANPSLPLLYYSRCLFSWPVSRSALSSRCILRG